jgi:beta-galactosidase
MIWAADPKSPPSYPIVLPKAQEITRVEWVGNAIYQRTKQIQLVFDNGKTVTFDTNPDNEPQFFDLPPGCVGKNITLKITDWTPSPNPEVKLVGIDYFRLYAKRPPAFRKTVRPMLTVGGMMEYTRGAGGIVLCNVQFKDTEAVPVNAAKKRNILATVLRNLHAPVGGAKVIVGAPDLLYTPVDLSKAANQYRTDRGWFGDRQFTFTDMPAGNQNFGGVPFRIYDFPTSPVPTAVMLGGSGVPGDLPEAVRNIPIGRKADALFFLHTARIDNPRNERDSREKKQFEMARYVVRYTDGKTETVPVYSEINIGDYHPKAPAAGLPGASLAWTRPYPGTDRAAAAYQMQWNNPRPEVPIASIDMEYGKDRRGVPVLLALTAAASRKQAAQKEAAHRQ